MPCTARNGVVGAATFQTALCVTASISADELAVVMCHAMHSGGWVADDVNFGKALI